MRGVESCHQQAGSAPAQRPDRRAFLRMGAGCAVPLLAGGLAGNREAAAASAASTAPNDSVLDHVAQELARTYHAMRGRAGIRGEHVRSLAASLDLIGVCLQSTGGAARADEALRRRIGEKGQEATAAECLAAYDELAVEMSLQYGVVSRADRDPSRAAAVLDSVAALGGVSIVRGHKAVLKRLAAFVDRAEAVRGATPRLVTVHQKPGDDFLGYPPGSVFDGVTLCQQLQALQWALVLLAGVLALVSCGTASGALALAAIILDLLKLLPCRQDVEL